MKKIIDGILCDTENAKFITGDKFPFECWELYQTSTGEYFLYKERELKPGEIELWSEEDAMNMIDYTSEEMIICPQDIWKRKKKVFHKITDYVCNDLNNPFKVNDPFKICVTERRGYLRIYNGRFFVCIGLVKCDFILDTDDMIYEDIDLVQDIKNHKETIFSMYYNEMNKEN